MLASAAVRAACRDRAPRFVPVESMALKDKKTALTLAVSPGPGPAKGDPEGDL